MSLPTPTDMAYPNPNATVFHRASKAFESQIRSHPAHVQTMMRNVEMTAAFGAMNPRSHAQKFLEHVRGNPQNFSTKREHADKIFTDFCEMVEGDW